MIRPHQIETLVQHVTAQAPDLLATCRWLLVDPRIAPLILGAAARPPSATDLARFLHLLRHAPPEVANAGHLLLAARGRLAAELDLALERLLAAAEDEWRHPTEILGPARTSPPSLPPASTGPNPPTATGAASTASARSWRWR